MVAKQIDFGVSCKTIVNLGYKHCSPWLFEGADKSDRDSRSNEVNEIQARFVVWIIEFECRRTSEPIHMNRAVRRTNSSLKVQLVAKKCCKQAIDFCEGCVKSKSIEAKARIRTNWGISNSSAVENRRTSGPIHRNRRFVEGHVARRHNDVTQIVPSETLIMWRDAWNRNRLKQRLELAKIKQEFQASLVFINGCVELKSIEATEINCSIWTLKSIARFEHFVWHHWVF